MANSDRSIRRGTGAAVLLVAAIAAVISFQHIQHLALTHGQTWLEATLLPLSIDGSVVASSLVLLRAARAPTDPPRLAQWILGISVAATIAANVVSGLPVSMLPYAPVAAILAGLPAALFIGCAEMAIMMVRKTAKPVAAPVSPPRKHKATPVRQIMAEEKVSSRTAQTIRRRETAAVKAANASSNGHA